MATGLPKDLDGREHGKFASDGSVRITPTTSGAVPSGNGEGTLEVTTAGSRVQLPVVSSTRVFIQAHNANGDLGTEGAIVVVGGAGVVAAAGTRKGRAFFASQGDWFEVPDSDLSNFWVDSTENGAKVHYYYQI